MKLLASLLLLIVLLMGVTCLHLAGLERVAAPVSILGVFVISLRHWPKEI